MEDFINQIMLPFKWITTYDWLGSVFMIGFAVLLSFLSHRLINLAFHIRHKMKKIARSEERKKRSATISKILKTVVDIGIWTYVIFQMMADIGINVASLTTSAGLLGMVIGFGLQNTIRDIVSGIFIVMENQYRVGDSVETMIQGRKIAGKVENITLRITQIRDSDGRLHTVRNGASEAITNMSFKYANVNMAFGVSYSTNIDKLEEVINRIGQEMMLRDDLRTKIIDPIKFVRINHFLDSSMEVKSVGRVKAGAQWYVAGEFRRLLKNAFDENDIEMPFPQLVIHDSSEIFTQNKKASAKPKAKRKPKKIQ